MNPKLNRKEFVICLVEVACVATSNGILDDAKNVLDGLRVLRPRLLELDLLEARIAINAGQHREGIVLLRNLDSSPTQWSMAKALMATCQQFLGDSDWQISVNDVLNGDATPDAVSICKNLLEQSKNKGKGKGKDKDGFNAEAEEEPAAVAQEPVAFQTHLGYADFSFHLRA